MYIFFRAIWLTLIVAASFLCTACNHKAIERKAQNMSTFTPRLQTMFDKTKTVCFGRFMVDIPGSTTVAWGPSIVPLDVTIYPSGVDGVKKLSQQFADELRQEKAIYHDHVPLLISIEDVTQPAGKIITGYDGFEAISDLKMNGYFSVDDYGVVINARPLSDGKNEAKEEITSIARRLRKRNESDLPPEPGNCIEFAFLEDKPTPSKNDLLEHIRIGFRLKEFPDAHLSIYVAPSNPHNPEDDSLEKQWKRVFEEATPHDINVLAAARFLRKSPRQIHDWQTGFEVLMRSPDEEGAHAHHDFQAKFIGVPHDPLKPYADIQFQTGVADNAAGATKASLTDEEAIAVWDKITSTIRVRPTSTQSHKTTDVRLPPTLPLGELAATGRTCPQTGLWEASEPGKVHGNRRLQIKEGDRMPHVMLQGKPSVWQKLTGERPFYRSATVWKLVGYDDGTANSDVLT